LISSTICCLFSSVRPIFCFWIVV